MNELRPNISDLPYTFPKTTQGQLDLLADVLEIPRYMVKDGDEAMLDAMVGTILYRHLDRHQKMFAMKSIRELESRPLMGQLVNKATTPALVNPKWGMWSLTNDELLSFQGNMQGFDDFASKVGFGASALSAKDLLKDFQLHKAVRRKHIVTLVIWGAVYANKNSLNKANTEVQRRSVMNQSAFH